MSNNWQPIETAPKHEEITILCWPRDDEHATAYWDGNHWRIRCCGQIANDITHWMLLPEAPTSPSEREGE